MIHICVYEAIDIMNECVYRSNCDGEWVCVCG